MPVSSLLFGGMEFVRHNSSLLLRIALTITALILGYALCRLMSHAWTLWGAGDDGPKQMITLLKRFRKLDKNTTRSLINFVRDTVKGNPIDDKEMAMETIIKIVGSLPRDSKARTKLTNVLITSLWDSLEHPPISYHGPKFQYRMPDGSYNNVHFPNLGKAGTPYAKSIHGQTALLGVQPDPGVLFDLLMKREDGKFRENEAGISSMLFYHASILIHDIFRTDHRNPDINLNSSYLDLSPLYGSCGEDQWKVRAMKHGLLKPDTFHDRRMIGQPAGTNVILILYNRFHNFVAQTLLEINEGGRFSCDESDEESVARQDEALFQTARLVTGGLYINISLHDYLRAITNTHNSPSSWTLDPRVDIPASAIKQGPDRGIGNQVTSEFNLLYRFHSAISLRDEKWLDSFFKQIFEKSGKSLEQLMPKDILGALKVFEDAIAEDPASRDFGGIRRGSDGKFNDADLVRILKESIDDPAGSFGPKNTPKALRVVEILGIIQSRKWQTASLNEFRKFFKLKPHQSFEDISENPEVADALRNLYGHPDMVEAYPGMWVEDAKPRMDPGSGFCAPYTVGRAVLSDAVTLVRSDRFYTTDYNINTLTRWGHAEVKQDYETLGGSMFYKLIQRGLPGWFPFNSLHVMQPMYTKRTNLSIAKKLKTASLYTEDDPSPPRLPVLVTRTSTIRQVLNDPTRFACILGKPYEILFPGRPFDFMISGDLPHHTAQRNLVGNLLFGSGNLKHILRDFLADETEACLQRSLFPINSRVYQFDLVKDVAIPVLAKLLGDLFLFDLKNMENPDGSYDEGGLYKDILTVRDWGYNNNDPAQSWNLRRRAQQAMNRLLDTTASTIRKEASSNPLRNLKIALTRTKSKPGQTSLREFGRAFVHQLLQKGKPISEVQSILIFTAVGAVGSCVTMVTEIIHYLIGGQKNAGLLDEILRRAKSNSDAADKDMRRFVLELQRLTTTQRTMRLATQSCAVDGQQFKQYDIVVCDLAASGKDSEAFPDPETVRLDRPLNSYMAFSNSPHQCLGREIALSYAVSVLRGVLRLNNLRPADGQLGILKKINRGGFTYYLSEDWSTLVSDAASWKLHFDDLHMSASETTASNSKRVEDTLSGTGATQSSYVLKKTETAESRDEFHLLN